MSQPDPPFGLTVTATSLAWSVDQVLLGVVQGRLVLGAVLELDVDPVVLRVERDALDPAVLDLADEVRVVGILLAVTRTDQLLGEKRQHDDDQNRKCRALEESAHEFQDLLPLTSKPACAVKRKPSKGVPVLSACFGCPAEGL